MAQIDPKSSLIRAALLRGLRVGIVYGHDDITAEYHFIKDPSDQNASPDAGLNKIFCVMCTSTASDPLRLSGVARSLRDFLGLIERPTIYTSNSSYTRKEVKLYPGDWYPCFETDVKRRIEQVKKMIPGLTPISARIEEEDERALKAERLRQEQERKRMEERAQTVVRRNPWAPIARLPHPSVISSSLTDAEISEMLARGFLPS
jgi:hypothetical protein